MYQKFSIAEVLADTIFSCTMELIFLMQASLLSFLPLLPILNQIITHVNLSFLYSLYAFEYKWCNMGWDIKQRIFYIETRWPYYFGFGLFLSIIVSLTGSYIISATLFAFIFPAYILSAIEADCENLEPIVYAKKLSNQPPHEFQLVKLRLPLFKPSLYLTDLFFKSKLFRKKQQQQQQQQQQQHQQQQQSKASKTAGTGSKLAEPKCTLRKTN